MSSINWKNGQLITLDPGDTATCQTLTGGQLYGLIFYNAAANDAGANISVVWSQSQPPVTVSVPGTTANQGLASVLFVNGSDTTTVSAAMRPAGPQRVRVGVLQMKGRQCCSAYRRTGASREGHRE